jgi:hypothetical protein
MQRTARAASIAILCSVFCVGCATHKITAVASPSIKYQTQDDPEKQLVCPPRPAALGAEGVTDKQFATFVNSLWKGYGTCWRSVESYKKYRKDIGARP